MKYVFLVTVLFAGIAHAETYNECVAVGDPNSGIYFENGYGQMSVNSSDHYFENLNVTVKGKSKSYKITGDGLYQADCEQAADSTSQLSLSKTTYSKFNERFDCDGTKIELQFDLSQAQPNGKLNLRSKNGKVISLDLNCSK